MCANFSRMMPTIVSRTLASLSYSSKASRSSWLQLRPIGDMLSMPERNSTKVPRFTGMSRSAK